MSPSNAPYSLNKELTEKFLDRTEKLCECLQQIFTQPPKQHNVPLEKRGDAYGFRKRQTAC